MVNSEFIKDIKKGIERSEINQRVTPGSTPRRYEPALGKKKHNERIHKESKTLDSKNLPFTFRKPFKPMGGTAYVQCDKCGHITTGTTATVGIICSECHQYSSVTEVKLDE